MSRARESESRALLQRMDAASGGISKSYDRKVIRHGNSRAATIPADRSMLAEALAPSDGLRVHLLRDGRIVIEDPRVHKDLSKIIGD